MKIVNIETVKEAIANCKGAYKWDKDAYCYALNAMYPYYVNFSHLKKAEVIAKFYERCETDFKSIAGFTTFKDIDCYTYIDETTGKEVTTKPFVGKLMFSSPINKENSFGSWNLSEDTESEIDFTIRADGSGFFEWSVEELDEYEEGMLRFENNVLVDYDGVFELPEQLLDHLDTLGYITTEVRV